MVGIAVIQSAVILINDYTSPSNLLIMSGHAFSGESGAGGQGGVIWFAPPLHL